MKQKNKVYPSLLWNLFTGKGTVRAGECTVRASEGKIRGCKGTIGAG